MKSPWTTVCWLFNIYNFFGRRNSNKLKIKYQSYLKSEEINAFKQNMCIRKKRKKKSQTCNLKKNQKRIENYSKIKIQNSLERNSNVYSIEWETILKENNNNHKNGVIEIIGANNDRMQKSYFKCTLIKGPIKCIATIATAFL